MRLLVLLGLCGCAERLLNSDPNTETPQFPLAVGASADISFLADLCAGPQRDANTTLYTCSDDSVKSVNSATASGPFEIVSATATGVRFKANGPGDATVNVDYVNGDGEQGEMSFPVKARTIERIDLRANTTLCPSQRVLAGQHLFAGYVTYGTDAGVMTRLISAELLEPDLTNATLVMQGPGRIRVQVGTAGTAVLASNLGSGTAHQVQVLDAATASVVLTAPAKVNRYADIYFGMKVMSGGMETCLPHGPWTLSFAPADVCAAFGGAPSTTYSDIYLNPSASQFRGRALQGLGTCTVTMTHATLPLTATAQIEVCAAGC